MTDIRVGTVPVPGATLYYEVRGTGPLLLLAQGGDGDTARGADLARRLAVDHTVVTYDRRGLSRSVQHDPSAPVPAATHAEDAHRLLAALTAEPALVFGSSFGALVGLLLGVAHPEQVDTLIAHDPATPRLLPPAERASAESDLDDLAAVFDRAGPLPALKRLSELVGADFADREPDVPLPAPPGEGQLANLSFFLANDLPQIRAAALDADQVTALGATGVRVVPATGRRSPRLWNHDCAQALAELLDTAVVEFPGGHSLATHPAAFTARLRAVLGGGHQR